MKDGSRRSRSSPGHTGAALFTPTVHTHRVRLIILVVLVCGI